MRHILIVAGIFSIIISSTLFATNDTQTLSFNIPKVTLLSIDPTIPFRFDEGQTNATGSSRLAISSNDPQTKLNITATGVNLTVSSNDIQCPSDTSTTMFSCSVGVKRIDRGTLTFYATRTQGDMNIIYTLAQ